MRLLRAAPALLCGLGVVYLVLLAVYSRPIADDWAALANGPHPNVVSAVDGGGRYSADAFVWLVVHLFGGSATEITPLVVMLALWISGVWALREVAHATGIVASNWELGLLAVMALVAGVGVAPSLIDNAGWLSGVGGYTAPLAAVICLAAWCWRSGTRDGRPWISTAGAFAGALAAAGFHELVGAILVPASILALATARALRGRRSTLHLPAAICAGAAVSLAINLLSPSTLHRAARQHARVDLLAAFRTGWHDLSFLTAPVRSGLVAMPVATGIVAWQLFGPAIAPRWRRWMLSWSLFFVVGPWLVVSALCAWANATESGYRAPFRAAFLFTSSAAIGVALLVVLALSFVPRLLSQRRATLLALVLVAGGLVAFSRAAAPQIRAERMRSQAVAVRAASVSRQLASGRTTIDLMPAPLLTVDSQALDLSFAQAAQQRVPLVDLVRSYYGISRRDTVRVIARQPRDYCLPGVDASWVGVRSCQELRAPG